ncbi:MAG: DUF4388 domain-containing protein [Myxococcales bacterium]|nr:DUF4388 domain-containing protein [Myxococcales bacterium]
MSIEDVFDWIDRRGLIGHLSVERGDAALSFHFDEGAITAASSNVPGEHLGQLLMSRGLISEEQLRDAFAVQADTGVFLGKVLLMSGTLGEAALKEVLEIKLREAVGDVLSWQGGHFHFEEGPRQGSEFEIRVPLRTTLDLGKLQVRRWHVIRERIPQDNMRFWVSDFFAVQDPRSSARVQAQVARIIACVERGISINQMVLEHHGRRFQVMSMLCRLLERGALTSGRRSELRADTGDEDTAMEIEAAARGRAAGGNKEGALKLTTEALGRDPESESLQALHKELQRSLFAELSHELLGTFRVPRILVDREQLESMDLDDHDRYLAGRIDCHWDLLSLMRISPVREVDALMTFKRLKNRVLIEL